MTVIPLNRIPRRGRRNLPSLLQAGLALASGLAVAGTVVSRVADLNPGAGGSFPEEMTPLGGVLVFSAYTPDTSRELWKYDGAGILLVADINDTSVPAGPGTRLGNGSDPAGLTEFNGALYFSAFDPRRGGELWRTDGTTCERVADINPDADDTIKTNAASSWPQELTVVGDRLFFSANTGTAVPNYELWQYDGASVTSAANIHVDTGVDHSSYPHELTVLDGVLLFAADDGLNGYELWRHDGAAATLLSNLNPGNATSSSFPKFFTAFDGALYFQAFQDAYGFELWKTDGTSTARVDDLMPGGASSNPDSLASFNGVLYFKAQGGNAGYELWRFDGDTVSLAADINPAGDAYPKGLTVFQDRLYFSATDGIHGWELWSFDGDTAALVRDLNPEGDAFPEHLTVWDGGLYFVATTPDAGYEIWRWDGATIAQVTDIHPGPGDSYPRELAGFGQQLCFSATDDGFSNWELWTLTGSSPGVLEVSPADGWSVAGAVGGPFSPGSIDYELTNSGGSTLEWTAARTAAWVAVSLMGGSLTPGQTTTVTVSFSAEANGLPVGDHGDVVTFTNTTTGETSAMRNIQLAVSPIGIDLVPDGATGQPRVTLHGNVGGAYVLEASDTLREWAPIAGGVAGPDGTFSHLDEAATTMPHRFYRGRPGP